MVTITPFPGATQVFLFAPTLVSALPAAFCFRPARPQLGSLHTAAGAPPCLPERDASADRHAGTVLSAVTPFLSSRTQKELIWAPAGEELTAILKMVPLQNIPARLVASWRAALARCTKRPRTLPQACAHASLGYSRTGWLPQPSLLSALAPLPPEHSRCPAAEDSISTGLPSAGGGGSSWEDSAVHASEHGTGRRGPMVRTLSVSRQ